MLADSNGSPQSVVAEEPAPAPAGESAPVVAGEPPSGVPEETVGWTILDAGQRANQPLSERADALRRLTESVQAGSLDVEAARMK